MRRIALLPMLAILAGFPAPASAQMNDNAGLYDRIDRLERDIQTLQAQLARGGAPASSVVTSPAAAGRGAASGGSLPGNMAVQVNDRMDQLEEQIRQLTGKVEEAGYKAGQTQQQLQRMQADVDLRFKELQGGGAAASGQSQVQMPAASAKGAANSADGEGPAPGPQALGTLSAKDAKAAGAAVPPPAQFKDPQAMYDDAYARIQKSDYEGAEAQFKAFVAKFPNHQLASNAQYWIADIAYSRKDYKQAAQMFIEAYKKYPKSGKAPDMLYKAGAAFARMDPPQKSSACTAFGLLFQEHPQMPDHVRREAANDKKKLGCQ